MRARWSNLGDFITAEDRTTVGAWYATGIPGREPGELMYYGGTSFASPAIAAGIAEGTLPTLQACDVRDRR
jgi:hypothetical protein